MDSDNESYQSASKFYYPKEKSMLQDRETAIEKHKLHCGRNVNILSV